MAKDDKVILTCTVCLSRNYTTYRNKKTHAERLAELEAELEDEERLELNKYCKKCGQHTLHKETK